MGEALAGLDPAETTLVVVVSKTFTTLRRPWPMPKLAQGLAAPRA